MGYVPLPSSVYPITGAITLVLLIWLGWASLRNPETLWAPGDLSRYHADIATCASCHEPFRGATSSKCAACHTSTKFSAKSLPQVRDVHLEALKTGESCRDCHTEHRGVLAQITTGALINPHGEFVFRVTGMSSCTACHTGMGGHLTLLDDRTVRHLMEEGDGAHVPGHFTHCLSCHVGGLGESEKHDTHEEN